MIESKKYLKAKFRCECGLKFKDKNAASTHQNLTNHKIVDFKEKFDIEQYVKDLIPKENMITKLK